MNINSDILGSTDSSRKISLLPLVLLFLLFFGGGIAVTFFFLKAPQPKTKLKPEITANNLQPQNLPAAVIPETLPTEIEIVPALKKPHGETVRKETSKSVIKKNLAGSIVKKNAPAIVSNISKKPDITTESATKEIYTSKAPNLRVNGIAFQNSNADSMAIVNGMPVSSGSIIEGVTVEEVQNDRVLFRRNLEKFEIRLGQSNR
ncbi:MAG: general secretion pathway protein GspB [Geobacteraceae bacterium]|nr:general secretion pathway protein GspB [Geobacteraceae bacterium]NTW79272.1 general secretion pathway protein GspB [Geobacteraceae bacterium]